MPFVFVPMLRFVRRDAQELRADEREPEEKARLQQAAASSRLSASTSTFNATAVEASAPSGAANSSSTAEEGVGGGGIARFTISTEAATGAPSFAAAAGLSSMLHRSRSQLTVQQQQQHLSKYYSVSLTGRGPYTIGFFKAMYYALTAPATKFIYNVVRTQTI